MRLLFCNRRLHRCYVRRTPLLSSRHILSVVFARVDVLDIFTHCSSSVTIIDGPVYCCAGFFIVFTADNVLLLYHRCVPLPVYHRQLHLLPLIVVTTSVVQRPPTTPYHNNA
uniref:Uncharacterized protein n=1 Tax=Schizaphis graminum TaxID=13262 RepID=A0A2S2NW30_SCHGA